MWRVGLFDLLHRRRRFVLAVLATSLAFGLSLLMTGTVHHLRNETDRIVALFDADEFVVASGGTGPFTTTRLLPTSVATALGSVPGVDRADPIVQARDVLKGKDVNMLGVVPGGLGAPTVVKGRPLRAAGEAVADETLGLPAGRPDPARRPRRCRGGRGARHDVLLRPADGLRPDRRRPGRLPRRPAPRDRDRDPWRRRAAARGNASVRPGRDTTRPEPAAEVGNADGRDLQHAVVAHGRGNRRDDGVPDRARAIARHRGLQGDGDVEPPALRRHGGAGTRPRARRLCRRLVRAPWASRRSCRSASRSRRRVTCSSSSSGSSSVSSRRSSACAGRCTSIPHSRSDARA